MKLETNRLWMRPFQPEDAENMFLLNQDPEVIRYTGDSAFQSIEDAGQFIARYRNYESHGYGRYSVFTNDQNEYVGWCGLNFNEDTRETDVGFRLLKNQWGKGYATEAAVACIGFGFELGLKKIIGRSAKENRASVRVLNKIGMQFEREFSAHGFICEQYFIENR